MNVSVDLRTFQRYQSKNSAKLMLHMSISQDNSNYLSTASSTSTHQDPTLSENPLLADLSSALSPSPPSQRFRPYPSNVHHVTKGRYITSNDPRGYIPVYEYSLNGQWIMMDVDDGYILWTGIWKALGNAKADIVKMIESQPDLAPQLRRVRGGYLKIQGTWMPHEVAVKLAQRVAYPIKDDLVPFFGPNFPETCLRPDQPGYGQVIPSTSGRRKPRKAATINTKGISTSTRQPVSAPPLQSGSFTLPSAGLSFHTPSQSQHLHHDYQYGSGSQQQQQHTLASALNYQPLSTHPTPIAIPMHAGTASLQQHGMQSHDSQTAIRPASAPVSSQTDNIFYSLYSHSQPGPPTQSDVYPFSSTTSPLTQHNLTRSDAGATPSYDAPSQRYSLQTEEQRPASNYMYHDSVNYMAQQQLQPLSAGSARSDRGNIGRSQHRYLPYPNPNNPTSPTHNVGHAVNSTALESTYSTLSNASYHFPASSGSPSTPITASTQGGPSPTLIHGQAHGFNSATQSPHRANISPIDDRMRRPLTASSTAGVSRETTEREIDAAPKTLTDSLAYSLPPISSMETSRGDKDKGDSAAVLKRLRTEESREPTSRDKSPYSVIVPEGVNLGRRRSLSEPPLHAGLLVNQTSASPGSTWTHNFSDSQGWGAPQSAYPSLHTHFTHHRANSGGMDSATGTSPHKPSGAYYARPPDTHSHPLPPSREHSVLTSPISPGTNAPMWSEYGSLGTSSERHLHSRIGVPMQSSAQQPQHHASSHVVNSLESSIMHQRPTVSPQTPNPDMTSHSHMSSRSWTSEPANPHHGRNGGLSNLEHPQNR